MALKSLPEVRHTVGSGNFDELNASAAQLVAEGWELLDCKLLQLDVTNQYMSVFYIWKRESKKKVEKETE